MTDDFDDRLRTALRSLASAVPTGSASDIRPVSSPPRPRALLPLGSITAVCVAIAAVVLVISQLQWATRPVAMTASPRVTHEAAGPSETSTEDATTTQDPSRYADGIPRSWQGEPVLRGQAALDRASASTDATPFLIALWSGYEQLHSCGANTGGRNPLITWCAWLGNVGDQPGLPSALGKVLRIDPSSLDLSSYAPGPLILRVHTHDKPLMTCPSPDTDACEHVMIAEQVVWSGDSATEPRPTSLSQAAAAFGVPATPSRWPVCMGYGFTGAPMLFVPATGNPADVRSLVVVFPSSSALAAAAPDAAANGQSDSMPIGHQPCPLAVHWLARGNVLVGVQTGSTGVDGDALVISAREALSLLPER
jgi:hypothetical protein